MINKIIFPTSNLQSTAPNLNSTSASNYASFLLGNGFELLGETKDGTQVLRDNFSKRTVIIKGPKDRRIPISRIKDFFHKLDKSTLTAQKELGICTTLFEKTRH